MVAVITGEFFGSTGEYELLCTVCKRCVGRVTRAEASGLSAYGEEVLCYDCEGVDPIDIPPILAPELGERLIIFEPLMDKFITWEVIDEPQPRYLLTLSTTLVCLSSSPYLPKLPQIINEGGENETC